MLLKMISFQLGGGSNKDRLMVLHCLQVYNKHCFFKYPFIDLGISWLHVSQSNNLLKMWRKTTKLQDIEQRMPILGKLTSFKINISCYVSSRVYLDRYVPHFADINAQSSAQCKERSRCLCIHRMLSLHFAINVSRDLSKISYYIKLFFLSSINLNNCHKCIKYETNFTSICSVFFFF